MTKQIDSDLGNVPSLAPWAERLTCYTAALGCWSADRDPRWWRPLLAGGPFLGIRSDGLCRWQFDHGPQPWAPMLSLAAHNFDDWSDARDGLAAALGEGSVIVAGDVFHLPWQHGYRAWHAPHWFVVRQHDQDIEVDDPLAMMTAAGPQAPHRRRTDIEKLSGWGQTASDDNAVCRARTRSVMGVPNIMQGRYAFLTTTDAPAAPIRPTPRLVGAEALHTLADHFSAHGADPDAYAQVDDLWQAQRQRELLVAAGEIDADLIPQDALAHWRQALNTWRPLPALLMHARLGAQAGRVDPAGAVVTMLRRAARFEDQHLVPDPMRTPPLAGATLSGSANR